MSLRLFTKRWMIVAQYVIAVGGIAFGAYLFFAYRALPFSAVFVVISLFNLALARWTATTPLIQADDEGITVKRAMIAPTVRIPWAQVRSVAIAKDRFLDVEAKDDRVVRLLTMSLELSEIRALVAEWQKRKTA